MFPILGFSQDVIPALDILLKDRIVNYDDDTLIAPYSGSGNYFMNVRNPVNALDAVNLQTMQDSASTGNYWTLVGNHLYPDNTTDSVKVPHLQVDSTLMDASGDIGTSGQILSSTATGINWIDNGIGTVTSVGFGDGTGFTINGSPITTSGSFEFALDFSEFDDITESTVIKFIVTDPVEKEIDIRDVDLSDFNNDLGLVDLYNIQVGLTTLQVAALGTYQQLIPAPGANKYIRVLNWDCKVVVSTQLEVGTQALYLVYSGRPTDYIGFISNTDVETATTTKFMSGFKATSGIIQNNTSVGVILDDSNNPSASSGTTMLFNITYEILDY